MVSTALDHEAERHAGERARAALDVRAAGRRRHGDVRRGAVHRQRAARRGRRVARPWQPADALATIVRELRLPRALPRSPSAHCWPVGRLLQALLRNPLADPYVLGISGGAAVAALLAMAAGASLAVVQGRAWRCAAALGSCSAARRSLFRASAGWSRRGYGVLLTGVMIAASTAALSLLLALAPDGRLRSMMFWLSETSAAHRQAPPATLAAARGAATIAAAGTALDSVLRGDVRFTQGVDVSACAAAGTRRGARDRLRRDAGRCGGFRRIRRAARHAPADRQRPARAAAGRRAVRWRRGRACRHGSAHRGQLRFSYPSAC